ncbi:MAG: HRDC domain-containing protein [Chloroflexota bacterium]|jgi:ribonuclease D|nr:HRDC domain-containing protein [Chloroflexota bacterium]
MIASLKNTELVWIDQPQKLRDCIDELSAQDVVAVDTESNSLYAYQEQVCLIQFSTRDKDYLVDALVLPDLSDLALIFQSDQILKVFHAAEYDLICLFRDYGFQFNYLFDTMIAARTLGYQKIGLGSLLEKFFNIHMDKKYQRANWGKRPLKPDMLEYARLDSHYLIPLQEKLRAELESSGLWMLALEDFRRLTKNIEDTTESSEKDFWKLHGARDLSPDQAAVLKSLYQFRERQAEAQDRPPFKILSHQALVEIARLCPKNKNELSKVSKLSRRLAGRYGGQLIKAVQEGKNNPPIHPPHHKRPADSVLDRIDALRKWRKLTGREMGVPSNVVLPRDVLNRIAWENPKNLEELEQQMQDVPYRFDRFGQAILEVAQNGDKPSQYDVG